MSHNEMTLLDLVGYDLLRDEDYLLQVAPEQCIIVAHLHVLPSTVALFAQLQRLGFSMESMVVVPKPYSTIASAEDALKCMKIAIVRRDLPGYRPEWYDRYMHAALVDACALARNLARRRRAKRVILVDDGGLLTDEWWRQSDTHDERGLECIAVQQTASGFYKNRRGSMITKVDVARSTAKKVFESKIIVDGLEKKIAALRPVVASRSIGVIGMGAIGSRLVQTLRELDKTVWIFDAMPALMKGTENRCGSWIECLQQADVIFGCTGKNFAFPLTNPPEVALRTLISLSSRDVEFKSFLVNPRLRSLRKYADQNQFGDILLQGASSRSGGFRILNGGFPINFDRRSEWEAASEIVLTRALVLLGILQALCLPSRRPDGQIEVLALAAQRKLVQSWLRLQKKEPESFGVASGDFDSSSWWGKPVHGRNRYRGNWKGGRFLEMVA